MKTKELVLSAKCLVLGALCAVGLMAFAGDPLGSKDNPWDIGTPTASDVEAWTNGMGRLDIDGTGAMTDFSAPSPAPWAGGSFTEAVVGSNVTAIGESAFKSCPNLKTLVLNEQTPPTLGAGNDFAADVKIFVPAGKAGAYRASEGWKAYKDAIEEMGSVKVDALSNKFALDLTAGDRIAADEETLVVDPAWGKATTATVKLQNGWVRTYNCASNDLWDTTALEPGRHGLAFYADAFYGAFFWKTGDDWVVFDSSNITADVTFEAGKTYLFFGTNTVDATLTVQDGAKFEYDESAPAGFLGGTVNLPTRYEQKTVGDLYQIVEKIKGCEDNPWEVGEGVTAYTNGTELVIGGEGTVTNIAAISGSVIGAIKAVTITDATVTGAEENAFAGISDFALTLPDGWQGELPDADGNWYGATVDMANFVYPTSVKNVKFQQRYPWNGLVDISCDLTGAGEVTLKVTTLTNDVRFVANPTLVGETTVIDLAAAGGVTNGVKLIWNAAADLPAGFKAQNVKVKVTVEKYTPPPPPVNVTVTLQLSGGGDVSSATLNIGGTTVNILNGAGSVDIVPGTYGVSVSGDDIDTTSLSPTSVTIAEGTSILDFTVSPPPPEADNFETMALEQLADGQGSLNQAENMFNRYSSSKDTMYLDQAAGFAGLAVSALETAATMAMSSTTISQVKKDEINTYLNQAKTLKEQIDVEKQKLVVNPEP